MSSHSTPKKIHYFLGSCFVQEKFRYVYIKITIKNSIYCNVQLKKVGSGGAYLS